MSKPLLRNKIVEFQREIISLNEALNLQKKNSQEHEDEIFLELFSTLDAFENIFNNMEAKQDSLDKTSKRMIKSFRSIYRKLIRLLEQSNIEQITFKDNISTPNLCKVIETRKLANKPQGWIITVIRNGYQSPKRILRPAEVITVE